MPKNEYCELGFSKSTPGGPVTFVRLETKIDERFNGVDKRIDDLKTTLALVSGILISIFVATLALPQILAYFKDRREQRKIKGVEISAQEFAELKAQVKALIHEFFT